MTTSATLSPSVAAAQRIAAVAALFFGIVLFVGAGFAGPSALHNATHDSRHALGLPCH